MYFLLAHLFGLAVDVFYRRRHLGGAVPAQGPVLLVANHPNGLIDPILVTRIAGRPVRFLAKEPLFRMPVLGWILRAARALPVYRPQDGHRTTANQDTFAAVHDALRAGDCVCLFPEGTSHSDPSLKPLKTGAARMALGAASAGAVGVQIVPVGLNYRQKASFRSEVAVEVGAPVSAAGAAEGVDSRDVVRALTEAIDAGIRGVTTNLDAWEDLPLLELAGQVWGGDADPAVRLRDFAERHRSFAHAAPDRVHALRQRLVDFAAVQRTLGVEPAALDRPYAPPAVARFVARNLVALLIGLPIAAVGALAYALPYWTLRILVARLEPEHDVTATYKVLGGMMFYPAWQFVLASGLVWHYGAGLGLGLACALPFAGLYALHFAERRARAWVELRLFFRLPADRAVRAELGRERDAIRAEIERLVTAP